MRSSRKPVRPNQVAHSPLQRFSMGAAIAGAIGALLLAFTPGAALADEEPLQYVALGDSYSSGVGAGSYIHDGTLCFRSDNAHSVTFAESIGAELDFQACGGATIPDVQNGQIDALSADTDLVSLGIGGNDTGWVGVLLTCALPLPPTCWDEIDEAEEYVLNEMPEELDSLYTDVREAAPNADVVITGYPLLFSGVQCQLLVDITPEEQERLNEATHTLNDTIAGVAAEHGFEFADVRDNFAGHAVCDEEEYLHGLTGPLVIESFHPNFDGQQQGYLPALEEAVSANSSAETDLME